MYENGFPKREKKIGLRFWTPSVLHFEVPSAIINIFYAPVLLSEYSLEIFAPVLLSLTVHPSW